MASQQKNVLESRILIVDDVADAVTSLAMLLQVYGARTEVALDGLEALRLGAQFRPDVVLLDIGMPQMNGYEAAQRIRQAEWGRTAILIALTGWGQAQDVQRALEAGFDGHLLKPVAPDDMVELITRLLLRRAGAAQY